MPLNRLITKLYDDISDGSREFIESNTLEKLLFSDMMASAILSVVNFISYWKNVTPDSNDSLLKEIISPMIKEKINIHLLSKPQVFSIHMLEDDIVIEKMYEEIISITIKFTYEYCLFLEKEDKKREVEYIR